MATILTCRPHISVAFIIALGLLWSLLNDIPLFVLEKALLLLWNCINSNIQKLMPKLFLENILNNILNISILSWSYKIFFCFKCLNLLPPADWNKNYKIQEHPSIKNVLLKIVEIVELILLVTVFKYIRLRNVGFIYQLYLSKHYRFAKLQQLSTRFSVILENERWILGACDFKKNNCNAYF